MVKAKIRKVIQPGILGVQKPKTYYQVQKGSKLRNFSKKSKAMKFFRKLEK